MINHKKLVVLSLAVFCLAFSAEAQQGERDEGITLYQQSKFDDAAEILEVAVTENKKDDEAWLYLGASYVQLGKRKEARRAFQKAKTRQTSQLYETPLKIISKKPARYTDEARTNMVTGQIRIAVEFRGDGSIGFIFPFETLPYGLTESAIAAVKLIRFEPALRNGNAVTVISILDYGFNIY